MRCSFLVSDCFCNYVRLIVFFQCNLPGALPPRAHLGLLLHTGLWRRLQVTCGTDTVIKTLLLSAGPHRSVGIVRRRWTAGGWRWRLWWRCRGRRCASMSARRAGGASSATLDHRGEDPPLVHPHSPPWHHPSSCVAIYPSQVLASPQPLGVTATALRGSARTVT